MREKRPNLSNFCLTFFLYLSWIGAIFAYILNAARFEYCAVNSQSGSAKSQELHTA